MEPLVPRHSTRRPYRLGLLLVAAAVGVAGWAPQPNRSEDVRVPSVATTAPASEAARPAQPAQPLRTAALAAAPVVIDQPRAAIAPVQLPPPRPASAPQRKGAQAGTVMSAQASAQASLLAEIAHFKAVLKLSPAQERQWPPVDAVLRDIAREQAATAAAAGRGVPKAPKLVIGDAEMNRLASAAFPLLMTLNEDQKRDAMAFARAMGLERVASAF